MLIVTAPYIDFRLHRTRSDDVEVQNRYLEQVVVGTGILSACGFGNSSGRARNVSVEVTPLMPGRGLDRRQAKLAVPSFCKTADHAGEKAVRRRNSQPNTFRGSG